MMCCTTTKPAVQPITPLLRKDYPMKKTLTTIAVLALCLMFSPMVYAGPITEFIIDNFTQPGTAYSVYRSDIGLSGVSTVTGLPTSDVVGGVRTMQINVTSTSGNYSTLTVNPAATGTLSFSNDSGQNSTAMITWDANGAGLGGVDITNGGTLLYLQADILASDLNLGFRVDITELGGGGDTAYWSTSLGSGASVVNQALSGFTNAGAVDFTEVNKIVLTLTGPVAQDGMLDVLKVTTPEPATMALLAFGSLGLLVRRKRS